jgi:hypothetical protein
MDCYHLPSFLTICPVSFKHKFAVTSSAVYCTLEHFTFYHLSDICQTYVQQYTAFETLSHVILLEQKIVNQKFTQGTSAFPNLDKTAFQTKWLILVLWRTELLLRPGIVPQCLGPPPCSVANVLTELSWLSQYCVLHNILFLPSHRTETSNTEAKQWLVT